MSSACVNVKSFFFALFASDFFALFALKLQLNRKERKGNHAMNAKLCSTLDGHIFRRLYRRRAIPRTPRTIPAVRWLSRLRRDV